MQNPDVKIKFKKNQKTNFEAISEVLKRAIRSNPQLQDEISFFEIQKFWPEVAGEIQQYAEPSSYKNKILSIVAVSSSWSQQIIFYKQKYWKNTAAWRPNCESPIFEWPAREALSQKRSTISRRS